MVIKFSKASFVASYLAEDSTPLIFNSHGVPLEEIAIVGRSNVGKSSLLNHLMGNSRLARVSGTPGKTQTLNFFNVDDQICIVDLPGYGFAKVPYALKMKWAKAIDNYLKTRQALKLIIILLDCRRTPSDEDIEMILWAYAYKKPFVIVFTKYDKLKGKERDRQKKYLLDFLHERTSIQTLVSLTYSVKNNHMRQVLINIVNETLQKR